jgi:protein-tyrosine phosphatase
MIPEPVLSPMTDIHSHLVPGVDDGARSMEDALAGVGLMVERGITSIVTTPHLDGSLTHDPVALDARLSEVDGAFARLFAAVNERFPEVELRRGHEVMLSRPDCDFSDQRLRLAGSDFVLVEWPRLQIPPESTAALQNLGTQGFGIVLAHPERYSGQGETLGLVARWRDAGAMLQVNHGSLLGMYGPEPRWRALRLLEAGWVDCLASDFHAHPGLRVFAEGSEALFRKLEEEENWWLLTRTNPARMARGERPLPVPPIRERKDGVLSRLLSIFRSSPG